MTTDDCLRPAAQWLWAGLTLAGLAVALLLPLVVVIPLLSNGLLSNAAEGLRLDLALWLVLFGALGMLGVLLAGRLAFGRSLEVRSGRLLLPLVGVALAIGEELALHEWAEASLGHYDWDFIGWTAGLSFALVVLAVASFALAIAPRSAKEAPANGVRLAVVVVLFVVLANAPGAFDGIGAQSWPIALLVAASGAYALAAFVSSGRA